MPFSKVLVANRGEVALRVIRACRERGLKTVAVFSEVDAQALHTRFADQAVCIGPARASHSYLNMAAIISAAEVSGAQAIHPGYGFLSENAEFADLCQRCGLIFIGPSAQLMRLMGDKVRARQAMVEAGVPVLPGSGVLTSEQEVWAAAEAVGYPLIVKASAGGGGRGMKLVTEPAQLLASWVMARTEAQAGFGCPDVYVERFIERPRHIEIQVVADKHGNAIHLAERECSIQRRHQKLVEEAPSAVLSEVQRARLGGVAVDACRSLGYDSVGTLEFLMDETGNCYFMEMNTRLQVEHTVTEEVTDVDIVEAQLAIAAGEKLGIDQDDVKISGHAIECRLNAEDPDHFVPSPGRITALHFPGGRGVRVDTAVYQGYVVPPHYDSLLAKLIVRGRTRARAIQRLRRALSELVLEGIKCNAPLFQRIVDHPDFEAGQIDTHFLERL